MEQLLWKTVCQFLKMLNTHLTYDSAIPYLGVYPREEEIDVHMKTCAQMFIVSLLQ